MNWLPWAILSAVFAALTAILAKVGVAGVDSNLATAIRTTVVLVFSWLIVFATHAGKLNLGALSRRTWFFLLLSGLATGLSWLCYFRALQLGPASKVVPIDKLSILLVIVIAAILHEPVKWNQWFGAALIAIGAIVVSL
jgi:bacterial/archaeal transporter family protein